MKQQTIDKRKILKGIFKGFLFLAILLIVLLGSLMVVVQIPSVQRKIVNKATDYLSKTLNFPVKIEGVHISWFDRIVIDNLEVRDPNGKKMIYIGESVLDYEIISLAEGDVVIDEIVLANGIVRLFRDLKGVLNMNELIEALEKLAGPKTDTLPSQPFTIPEVKLKNMAFRYNDLREPAIPDFDHFHFGFDSIYADVFNLKAIADTFQIDVRNLKTVEINTGLRVKDLDAFYTLTKNKMNFERLSARISDSFVSDYLCFSYKDIDELSDFNKKVIVTANLTNSYLSVHDLSFFAPALKPYSDHYNISGSFKGKVVDFGVKNLSFGFGKNSVIKGRVKFDGLPNIEETFTELHFNNTDVSAADLKQYLDPTTNSILAKFRTIKGKGEYVGFINDFVAKGEFSTGLGRLISDINLKIDEKSNPSSYYRGHLQTFGFNFGKLIDQSDEIGLIDMNGKIEGRGFTLEEANLNLDAHIRRLGIKNYDYKNIRTNAKLSRRMFNGEISVQDSNLIMNATGEVDLNLNKNLFNIHGKIARANLKALHLSETETSLRTNFTFDFKGTTLDDVIGEAVLNNTYILHNNNKEIDLTTFRVRTFEFDGQRTFSLFSNFGNIEARGNFKFTSLINDFKTAFKEYRLNIQNNTQAIANYYRNKPAHSRQKYEVDFTIALQNVNSLISIYLPNLYISPGVIIEGDFTSGYTTILNLNTKVDTILFQNHEIYKSSVELSASKISDSSNVLGMLYISSESQKIGSLARTENIFFEGEWFNNAIDFRSSVSQAKSTNNASVIGNLTFEEDKEILVLRESNFNILNKTWGIAGTNKVTFFHDEILFENFTLANNQQSLSINGYFSQKEERTGTLIIENLQMETINPIFSGTKLKGILDGKLNFNNFYKNINVEGEISLRDFIVDGFLIGDIHGTSEYNRSSEVLDLDIAVERLGKKIIEVEGYFKPQLNSDEEQMKLVALLDEAELGMLQPLLSSFMSNIKGTVSGDFTLSGTIKDPIVNGVGKVKNGSFKIDYLGTSYTFDDEVYMEDNLIGFKQLKLKDIDGHTAVVDGGLYHDHFRDFIVDIKARMKEFNVLKLTDRQNKLFYGDAFVSGDLEILGAFSNLEITTNVTSNKGTKIYIPLTSNESMEQQSYITFKKKSDHGPRKDSLDLSGIRMELNLDITEDAYAEIIFDKKAGDIIRGYGKGNIKMKIDTRGDFSMFGNYQITKGAYNFTLAGLINKEFEILPNSSISWTGDPYAGLLDIKANYSQYVSLAPLIPALDTAARKLPENRRKYPVDVEMKLVGNLLTPDIDLGIDILRFPGNLAGEVTAYEARVLTDEQELNRQVFSLLVLASISPVGYFSGVNSTGNNLSEMLSNQLSSWLSQVDENLQIDVNLNSLDRNAINTFQLRMSYTMMDGRLRITRDGSFQNVQDNQQANFTNIAGEWTLEYLLSPDGKFRLKLYNKANQNMLLASTGVNSGTSAGFSVLHTQSFDNLKDLFQKKSKKQDDSLYVPVDLKKVKSKPAPVPKNQAPPVPSNVQTAAPARTREN